ncbi:MAG: hypothetical protein FJ306_08515 [Planctomycetes bacterium]|nr:hypothetical protein [Planctomycetota bacterium]
MPKTRLLLWLLPCFAACSGNEIVGLHLRLQPDGSADLTARALVASPTPSPAEVTGKGVAWGLRGALVHTQGTVAKLADLRFGDDALQFVPRMDANKLTVRIQRSAAAGWVAALTPDKRTREQLAVVVDTSRKTTEVGDVLRLEIELPAAAVGSSVLPSARGVEAGRDGRRAWLSIPVATAREPGEALTWDVTWN